MTERLRKLMDEAVFRPSSFPMLDECIHFDGTKEREPDQYRTRGSNWHLELSKVLSGKKKVYRVRDRELRDRIRWVMAELKARHIGITATEIEAVILDEAGVRMTVGHVDAEGFAPAELPYLADTLAVIDFKTGDKRNYHAQFAGYMMSRMDAYNRELANILTFYLDLGIVEAELWLANETNAFVLGLRDRWLNRGQEEPHENEYCGWCAKRATCPVWNLPAREAFDTVTSFDDDVQASYWKGLKQDPVALGAFYTAYKKLKKLVEEDHKISSVIMDHLQMGTPVPGYHIGGRSLADEVIPARVNLLDLMLHVLPEIGSTAFANCITGIDLAGLAKAWDAIQTDHTRMPFPVEVIPEKRIPGRKIQFAVANGPPGRGRAAMARKERQVEL